MGSNGVVQAAVPGGRGTVAVLLLISVLIVLLLCAYWQSPRLLQHLIAERLTSQSAALQQFEASRPTLSGWQVERLRLTKAGVQLQAEAVDLRYTVADLWQGRLESIAVERLTVRYTALASGTPVDVQGGSASVLPDRLDPGYWLAQLPWRQLTVARMELLAPAAEWRLAGELKQQHTSLTSTLVTATPARFAGQRLEVAYTPSAGLRLALREPNGSASVRLTSRFAQGGMDLQLRADVQDDLAALLAQSVGIPDVQLNTRLSARSRVPWPLPDDFGLASLAVLGQIDLDLHRSPDLRIAGLGGLFSLTDGRLEWTVDTGTVRFADAESRLVVECRLREPILAQAQPGWLALSDGLGCEASDGIDQMALDLRNLLYEQADENAGDPGAALEVDVGFDTSVRAVPLSGSVAVALRALSSEHMEGRGTVFLQTLLLAAQPNQAAHPVPFVFRYWPADGRAELDAQLRLPLASRLLSTLQLPDAEALDVGGAQVNAEASIRWRPDQFEAALEGSFRKLRVYSNAQLPPLRPLGGTFKTSLADDALQVTGNLRAGALRLPFTAQTDLNNGAGGAQVQLDQAVSEPLLTGLFEQWQEPVELTRGLLHGAVSLRWEVDQAMRIEGEVALHDGSVKYEDLAASGVHSIVAFENADDSFKAIGQILKIARLEAPVPVVDIESTFRLTQSDSSQRLQLGASSARLLGGQASFEAAAIDLQQLAGEFEVVLSGLSLADVLALEGEDISGTGLLDGRLPVQLKDGAVRIANGSVAARAPGGEIRIGEDFTAPTGQPGLDFALQALADFRYSELSADVDYAPDGELLLAVRLRGNNPAVEKGRAIHYNLNVTENVPSLLESLQADALLTEQIQKKVEREVNR